MAKTIDEKLQKTKSKSKRKNTSERGGEVGPKHRNRIPVGIKEVPQPKKNMGKKNKTWKGKVSPIRAPIERPEGTLGLKEVRKGKVKGVKTN